MPGQEKLAQRLIERTFADTVFFTNSGAEALECAIKMARKYQSATGHPERYRLITFEGAFHGRTLATIAAGGQAKYLEGFGPKVEGFDQVPFGARADERVLDYYAHVAITPDACVEDEAFILRDSRRVVQRSWVMTAAKTSWCSTTSSSAMRGLSSIRAWNSS